MAPKESSRQTSRPRPRAGESSRRHKAKRKRTSSRRPDTSSEDTREERRSKTLSADALAQLDRHNRQNARQTRRPERPTRDKRGAYHAAAQTPVQTPEKPRKHGKAKKRRVVSGALMEEGRVRSGLRGGGHGSEDTYEKEDFYRKPPKKRSRKKWWLIGAGVVVIIMIVIVVAVVVSQQNSGSGSSGDSGAGSDTGKTSTNDELNGQKHSDIPNQWQNTYLDPWSWETTEDFNTTFTDEMVGDLPVMGLNSDYDDTAKANDRVPALNEDWGSYGDTPARGVNLGGWLSLEPFITPSLFDYDESDGVVDEWTLSSHLGTDASSTLEKHYATFVTEDTFKDIQAAGLDHIRIPYSYWAVEVFDQDPYVFRTSWRYLLRGIEWARKYGLRVNLDLHGLPGSQNGWNHSGRWGPVYWFNGTDGDTNVDRSTDIHDRLTKFFAQDRYKNIITHYGVANEPRMTFLPTDDVISWTEKIHDQARSNGLEALIVFGDGFMGLNNWQGLMTGYDDMVLDVHQYVIFNVDQIDFTHQKKVQYACSDWTQQTEQSMDTSTGYGPTHFAEWSQADTDCANLLTGVGKGTRWEGDYVSGDADTSATSPLCPTKDDQCSCDKANADPSTYSAEYKKFLKMFAEAQMHSFEKGWGWWYWTWKTESAAQWSYESGLKAGILPSKPWDREFNCDSDVPDFSDEGLPETY